MNAKEKTEKLMKDGWKVITNPFYLESDLSEKSVEEIKAARQDKTQPLPPAAQQELSLRVDRTAFIEFHRFMYSLDNSQIQNLADAMKKFVTDKKPTNSPSKAVYCDERLLKNVIDYHLCIRFEKWFDAATADQIAGDYRQNQKLSQDFPEITSQHLIKFAKDLLGNNDDLAEPESAGPEM